MNSHNALRGILLTCVVALIFACMDSLAKALAVLHGVVLMTWMRYLVQAVLLGGWLWSRQGSAAFRLNCPQLQVVRGACQLGISLFFFSALRFLPIGEATAVQFIAPLLVILLAGPLLGERARAAQGIAVLIGFAGVLIIVRPGGGLLTLAMLLPLGSAFCHALYQLLTRRIAGRDSVLLSNFMSGVVGLTGMTPLLFFFWNGIPDATALLGMAALGAIAMGGHLLMTQAFHYSSPVLLAPFSYLQILFASVLGIFLFQHQPDVGSLVGMAVIAAGGLFSLWLQTAHRRTRA